MSLAEDIAAVGTTEHTLAGTSAAFERILQRLRDVEEENDDRRSQLIEAAEARDYATDCALSEYPTGGE